MQLGKKRKRRKIPNEAIAIGYMAYLFYQNGGTFRVMDNSSNICIYDLCFSLTRETRYSSSEKE
jgi:hypothetical protein